MKAALLSRIGQLDVADLPRPAVPPGGVLVAVKAASICRSDIKMFRQGQRDLVSPPHSRPRGCRRDPRQRTSRLEAGMVRRPVSGSILRAVPGMPLRSSHALPRAPHLRLQRGRILPRLYPLPRGGPAFPRPASRRSAGLEGVPCRAARLLHQRTRALRRSAERGRPW